MAEVFLNAAEFQTSVHINNTQECLFVVRFSGVGQGSYLFFLIHAWRSHGFKHYLRANDSQICTSSGWTSFQLPTPLVQLPASHLYIYVFDKTSQTMFPKLYPCSSLFN